MTENAKNVECIFEQNYKEYCLLSYSYVGCMDQAQDIVQEVFVRLLMNDKLSNILNLKAYVWTSVKNNSLKQLAKSKKMEALEQSKLAIIEEDENQQYEELGFELRKAISALPPQCKIIFELCAVDGYKYQTTANSLGISINTVKTQMKKAYKVLRHNLSDVYLSLLFLFFTSLS